MITLILCLRPETVYESLEFSEAGTKVRPVSIIRPPYV